MPATRGQAAGQTLKGFRMQSNRNTKSLATGGQATTEAQRLYNARKQEPPEASNRRPGQAPGQRLKGFAMQ